MNKTFHASPPVFSNVTQPRIDVFFLGYAFSINYPCGAESQCPVYSAKDRDLNGKPITMHFIP
jgi:hypothetical protein